MTKSVSTSKTGHIAPAHAEFPYHGFSPELTPIIPIEVHHDSFPAPIQVFAKVDTGFPRSFIMSETLGKTLKEVYHIIGNDTDNLVAIGVFTVFCEVFPIAVRLPRGRWVRVKAFLPQGIDLGNVMGMELLRTVDVCFKGNDSKLVIVTAKAK